MVYESGLWLPVLAAALLVRLVLRVVLIYMPSVAVHACLCQLSIVSKHSKKLLTSALHSGGSAVACKHTVGYASTSVLLI